MPAKMAAHLWVVAEIVCQEHLRIGEQESREPKRPESNTYERQPSTHNRIAIAGTMNGDVSHEG